MKTIHPTLAATKVTKTSLILIWALLILMTQRPLARATLHRMFLPLTLIEADWQASHNHIHKEARQQIKQELNHTDKRSFLKLMKSQWHNRRQARRSQCHIRDHQATTRSQRRRRHLQHRQERQVLHNQFQVWCRPIIASIKKSSKWEVWRTNLSLTTNKVVWPSSIGLVCCNDSVRTKTTELLINTGQRCRVKIQI